MCLSINLFVCCQTEAIDSESESDAILPVTAEIPPYTASNYEKVISLPDSLSGKGNVVLNLYLNKDESLKGFNIEFLNVINEDTIRYHKYHGHVIPVENYPLPVRVYYDFFEDIVSEIKIERKNNVVVNPNLDYFVSIPLKFE